MQCSCYTTPPAQNTIRDLPMNLHTPDAQAWSLPQGKPSACTRGTEQVPFSEKHVLKDSHELLLLQTTSLHLSVQKPALQVPPYWPQEVPSSKFTTTSHSPDEGLQSATWQGSDMAGHVTPLHRLTMQNLQHSSGPETQCLVQDLLRSVDILCTWGVCLVHAPHLQQFVSGW
jgi:hypothetical protein